ncbi:hypothetical protein C8R46DRAFT_1275727 [Mycena filopes]|nr:hypothetical protein C8R46DRAFT_1275727 [Mycena filopes]
MDVDPKPAVPHPCNQNPNPKSTVKPETTFTLRYMKMCSDRIPLNYPYILPPNKGIFPNKGDTYEYTPVPYFEFRALGAPPPDVGTPGDVYIDTTPNAQALYTKSEEDWSRWPGPASPETPAHPHFADCNSARFVWFHPKLGVEWVCVRTVLRRQSTLRVERVLRPSHGASPEASLGLASEIIGRYLAAEAGATADAQMDVDSDMSLSEEENEVDDLSDADTFYPSKRARRLASGTSPSVPLLSPRSRAPPPPSSSPAQRPHHPITSPDNETLALEQDLAALKADPDLKLLRTRKRELIMSLAANRRPAAPVNTLSPTLVEALKKEFTKCRPSAPTAEEAQKALPDLRQQVEESKRSLLALKARRVEVARQLEERMKACAILKAKT